MAQGRQVQGLENSVKGEGLAGELSLPLVQDLSFSAGGVVALGAEESRSDLLEIRSSSAWTSVNPNLEPDLRTVPGVLLPPPVGWPPGPGEPAFLVKRLLKKLARTPSLV